MKIFLKCIIIGGLVLLYIQNNYAQENDVRYRGLRIGADIGDIVINGSKPGVSSIMFLTDFEFKDDKFAVFEFGNASLNDSNDSLSYLINGNYGLLGIDLNLFDRGKRVNDDILYFGFRYGFSLFSQDIDLLPDYLGNFDATEKETYSAHWAEIVTGGKAEIWFFKNVFVGLSIRTKILINSEEGSSLPPSAIPGYGDATKSVNFELNWTISYRIPFKKVKIIKKDEEKK